MTYYSINTVVYMLVKRYKITMTINVEVITQQEQAPERFRNKDTSVGPCSLSCL